MKKLTIGLFVEHYDPFVSGVVTSTKTLRTELEKRGHKVYIIAPKVKGFEDNDPAVIRYASFATPDLDNTTVGIPNPVISRRLNKIKFDVVHSQEVFFSAALAYRVSRRQKIPYVQSYHTLWDRYVDQYHLKWRVFALAIFIGIFAYPFLYGPRHAWYLFFGRSRPATNYDYRARWIWKHMINLSQVADAVCTPSLHLKNEMEAADVHKRLHHIPNGVTPFEPGATLLPPKTKALRVISVARLSSEKRVDVLIKAMTRVPGAELVMVGDGPLSNELKDLAARLKVQDRVMFVGQVDNGKSRQLISESDVLALASYDFDNQPMVILEAIYAGLPVIYCDPKLEEGLTEANSLLVGKDEKSFAKGINRLTDIKLRRQLSVASKKEAARFSSAHITSRILDIYKQSIARVSK